MHPQMAARKLKLLIVILDLYGGTGTFTRNLGRGIRTFHHDEFDVTLLCLRQGTLNDSDNANFDRIQVLHSAVHEGLRRAVDVPIHMLRLRRAIRRIAPDIIFTAGTYSNLLVSLVAKRGMPVILSEHMDMSRRVRAASFGLIMRQLMRQVYPRHLMVCAAEGIAADLREHFGVRRTLAIPNGLDLDHVRQQSQAAPGGPLPSGPFLIGLGSLTPQKDLPTMLRAFAMARSRGMAHQLVLVGEGPDRQSLQDLTQSLGLADTVHFLGPRSNPYPILKHADFLVLSSLWEGFAYAPVEAMALDVPCILTRSSGPEAILDGGKYGLLVPPRDPQKLADAMLEMSDPQNHARYVAQARIRAAQLGLAPMARAYRDLFFSEVGRQ
jgi:glycosyltransferase involved in cell wall biosynthesis